MTITKRINSSVTIFIVLILLTVVFVIFPLSREIKSNSRELVFQKESSTALQAKILNLEKFKVLRKSLEEFLEKTQGLFVNSSLPIEFINFLETISGRCQVQIEISPPSAGKIEKDPWPSLTFQISLTGSFSNFLKFLEKLENSPYLVEIQNVNISKATKKGGGSPDDVGATFSLKVFAK